MAIHDGGHHPCILLLLLQFLVGSVVAHSAPPLNLKSSVDRTSFPKGFIFGAASSSYQYEGGAKEGGRGPSIWDTFTHKYPHKIADGQNGDVAIDSYNRYKEDVANLKEIGFDAYRFSISWSRILPNGKLKGGVNPEGIKYYDNLINELLQNGIQPYVTLFHWDLPQALEDEYGGFLGEKIVDDFRDYAGVCFKHFGDRVKNWITLNEPHTYSNLGYAIGSFAPGHCTDWQKLNCTTGDSGTEPYIVSHNFLLAHAAAFELYRKKYKRKQQGDIGITLVSGWFIPNSEQSSDKDAVQRAIDFMFGWYMDPLTSGDYPKSMRSLLGNRLPKFTKHQSNLVKGSFDFLGLNYYTTNYATNDPRCGYNRGSYTTDSCAILSGKRNEVPIGPTVAASWLYVYPKGLYELLTYIKKKYNNPIIYITENGVSDLKKDLSVDEALADTVRIDYYDQHLSALRDAIHKEKVQVKGYFAWSLMDNFEWADGYTVRFGLIYVDYNHGLMRYSKQSAHWFRKFLKTQTTHAKEHTLDKDGVPLKDPQEL